jgi:Protein of unknown function (DUF4058)
MPSPFPGMNPFLEQDDVWQDFHDTFIPFVRDALASQVAPHYIVKVEAYLFIHEPPAEQRILVGHGDIGLSRSNGVGRSATATATRRLPARIRIPSVDTEKHLFLEIRDRLNRELISVIEMLSASNKKSGPDREQYLAKRGSMMRSAAHFVEIDLLRGGPRMPMENAVPSDYCIMVSRVDDRPDADFWPLSLRDSLPTIPIPLRPPHSDAEVDLQAVLHRVYDSAKYGHYIYKESPSPPLSPEDAAWASALITAAT